MPRPTQQTPTTKPSAKGTTLRLWLIVAFVAMWVGLVGSGITGVATDGDTDAMLASPTYWVLQVLFMVGTVASFVLSIVHLTRYAEKGMAVTFLVLSSIFVLVLVFSFLVGLLTGLAESVPAA